MTDKTPTDSKKLSDFKPLKRLILPELGELNASGLTIFVGTNSSGKTQLVRDIRFCTNGEVRHLVVAAELDVDSPDFDEFIVCLKAEGHIFHACYDNDRDHSSEVTTGLGALQGWSKGV